ncbi:MAG: HIT domain-containing protein [Planctomycetia bacterium]|nr:HIT domain-containing protein [Planctomycetia bacterium]
MTNEQRLDVIWAPWRYEYIQSPDKGPSPGEVAPEQFLPGSDSNCFLCQAAVCSPDQELERYIIQRGKSCVTLLNRFPYNNGHLLIAPKRHIASIDNLSASEWEEITRQMCHWTEVIRREMKADGFNIGLNMGHVAGAGLPGHIHWHIVPRWNGDTNFMTTLASTKAIPQSLASLTALLREHLLQE